MPTTKVFGSFALPTPAKEDAKVFPLTKTDLATADSVLLDTITGMNNGDIAVISTVVGGTEYGKSSYTYDGAWVAITGNVDADKVIFTEDLTLAGNYNQFGNVVKPISGKTTLAAKGKSLATVMDEILYKEIQPQAKDFANPKIDDIELDEAGILVADAFPTSITFPMVSFNSGSYPYGPATGVTLTSVTATAHCGAETSEPVALSESAATVFTLDSMTLAADELYFTLEYTYSDGVAAYDNVGVENTTGAKIVGKTVTVDKQPGTTIKLVKPLRYGSFADKETVDDVNIADLTAIGYENDKAMGISVAANSTMVVLAIPESVKVKDIKVTDEGALGMDITSRFEKTTAEGYAVYTYVSETALRKTTYNITVSI